MPCCVKDGQDEDAKEFLGLYSDALDEELVELRTNICIDKAVSGAGVDVLEEEAQLVDGQTGRKQGNTVCQSFFLCSRIDVADGCMDHKQASSVESPISRIFGGRSNSHPRSPGLTIPRVPIQKSWHPYL